MGRWVMTDDSEANDTLLQSYGPYGGKRSSRATHCPHTMAERLIIHCCNLWWNKFQPSHLTTPHFPYRKKMSTNLDPLICEISTQSIFQLLAEVNLIVPTLFPH